MVADSKGSLLQLVQYFAPNEEMELTNSLFAFVFDEEPIVKEILSSNIEQ